MPTIITTTFSNFGNRNEVRKRVFDAFSEETPGKGNGENVSKYDYYVEVLSDGRHIILTRPANLKNGFDFLIRVEGIDFSNGIGRRRDYPKHEDIIEDIRSKKRENSDLYAILYSKIKMVFECNNLSNEDIANISFSSGYPVDMLVGVIKWFFIEQDIRYWNYSGRAMLMSAIDKI